MNVELLIVMVWYTSRIEFYTLFIHLLLTRFDWIMKLILINVNESIIILFLFIF